MINSDLILENITDITLENQTILFENEISNLYLEMNHFLFLVEDSNFLLNESEEEKVGASEKFKDFWMNIQKFLKIVGVKIISFFNNMILNLRKMYTKLVITNGMNLISKLSASKFEGSFKINSIEFSVLTDAVKNLDSLLKDMDFSTNSFGHALLECMEGKTSSLLHILKVKDDSTVSLFLRGPGSASVRLLSILAANSSTVYGMIKGASLGGAAATALGAGTITAGLAAGVGSIAGLGVGTAAGIAIGSAGIFGSDNMKMSPMNSNNMDELNKKDELTKRIFDSVFDKDIEKKEITIDCKVVKPNIIAERINSLNKIFNRFDSLTKIFRELSKELIKAIEKAGKKIFDLFIPYRDKKEGDKKSGMFKDNFDKRKALTSFVSVIRIFNTFCVKESKAFITCFNKVYMNYVSIGKKIVSYKESD